MRLGGFVIHGNNADTLGGCLDSLLAVCDDVVAIDSRSTDGSADIVASKGVRSVIEPWKGYGNARSVAARELAGCDWILFLDSDEWLGEQAIEAFRHWRREEPKASAYLLRTRDWAELPGGRFLFRTEKHVRLMRREHANWTGEMIVHEALPRKEAALHEAIIEHRFATSVAQLTEKQDRYALLWAIRAHAEGKAPKSPLFQRPAHVLRDGLLKGAFFRGGAQALQLAWGVSRYHARKHELLAEIRAGGHKELVDAYARGDLEAIFR